MWWSWLEFAPRPPLRGVSAARLLPSSAGRAALLLEGEPDYVACETLPCVAEAKALVICLERMQARTER